MDGADFRVDFAQLPWVDEAAGLRTKTLVRAGLRARLLEVGPGFVEPDWCTRGHAFHLLEGGCSLETRGGLLMLAKGDVGLIPGGAAHGHKLVPWPGERALLLVFDEVDAG